MQSLRLKEAYLLRRYRGDRAPGTALHGKVAFPLEDIGQERVGIKEVISTPTLYPSVFPRIWYAGSPVSGDTLLLGSPVNRGSFLGE